MQKGDYTLKVIIVVGELSGDLLAANLVAELQKKYPPDQLYIAGVIGPNLANLGVIEWFNMQNLNIMGFIEPLLRLPKLLYIKSKLLKKILEVKPDLFIGVDAPEFNLRLAKILKRHQIKTVHYVSPSVWAWRRGRIALINQAIDLMLPLFPFEEEFYKEHSKIKAICVGHPLADQIDLNIEPKLAKRKLGFNEYDKILTIMPGSRSSELRYLTKIYLQTAKEIYLRFPFIKFIIPVTTKSHQLYIQEMILQFANKLPITVVTRDQQVAIQAADLILVTSGTATLEAMLYKKPMVVAYKTNFITYLIIKKLIKVAYIALPNLLNGSKIVKEFIQDQVTIYNLTTALSEIINFGLNSKQQAAFNKIHQQLRKNASQTAANEIMNLLECIP